MSFLRTDHGFLTASGTSEIVFVFFSFLSLFFQFIVQCCRLNWPCHGTQFLSAHYCTGLSYCIKAAAVRLVMPTHGHGWGEQQSWFSSHKGRIPRHRQRAREEIARVGRKDIGVSGQSVSVSWNAAYMTRGRVMKAQKNCHENTNILSTKAQM